MTPEQLLIRRYLVIAEYPSGFHTEGCVLWEKDNGMYAMLMNNNLAIPIWGKELGYEPNKYPKIFRELPWYAERHKSDFPIFVKSGERDNYRVARLRDVDTNTSSEWCLYLDEEMVPYSCKHWVPATLEEFKKS